jgi:UDP-N-acetylmuramyl pentapeptide phosphotransferase/UDP-N-acetylglucosamine-1-phosphate transferase
VIPAFAALAFVLSVWLTVRFSRPGSWFYILDVPNERSLHDNPKPRSGGVAMLIAVYATLALAVSLFLTEARQALVWVGAAGLLVAGISFVDDRISIHVIYRLIAHVVAALLILQSGLGLERIEFPGGAAALPAAVAGAASLLYVVWMINLYNFMDGMDGLAAGMAVSGFGTYTALGIMVGDVSFALANAVIAASAGGFLIFNFPPARIFMGDVGSSLLGLFAAAVSLWGIRQGIFPFWVALLVFSPFIVDATVTLFRRILCRERFWEPHRSHYYQRLVRSGWSHRQVALGAYALMLACGASALWGVERDPVSQWLVMGVWAAIYGVLLWLVPRMVQHRRACGDA